MLIADCGPDVDVEGAGRVLVFLHIGHLSIDEKNI
jgi:hypothetical protein